MHVQIQTAPPPLVHGYGPASGPAHPEGPGAAAEAGEDGAQELLEDLPEEGAAPALAGTRIVVRNAKGEELKSLPKALQGDPVVEQLRDLSSFLESHAREARQAVELWMLRSLPVPAAVLTSVWADPDWAAALGNAVVVPADDAGRPSGGGGFLRGADPGRGLGWVDLDGETSWSRAPLVRFPHPVLLEDLADWRALATELSLTQGIAQLHRETFTRGPDVDGDQEGISRYSGGTFEELNHALRLCQTLGYRVRGGSATVRVWEAGRRVEARFWIGSDDPECETETDELVWVDAGERTLRLGDVGPVAWSEGVRMAEAIYAGRKVDEDGDEDA